ncbi:hypothetical protein [Bacillus sp. ISTL8]|uniref:hypothetical protein n=1 Tax=Bacillus sp. ISTL8 TaxID=2596896 RepID=UPI001ABF2930|nr:hypothetical protein [Bacillus sp. ISTL8]
MMFASFFQAHRETKRTMNEEFKGRGLNNIKVKRFIFGRVLGYAPNIKDMTISEMEQVIHYLKNTQLGDS